MNRFIQIDEEGYFSSGGTRITDTAYGAQLLNNIYVDDRVFKTRSEGLEILVEAFDAPYVARGVELEPSGQEAPEPVFRLNLVYGVTARFQASSLMTDDWDRFHGRTTEGIPFVFSRAAQMQFFDLLEEFDDDSFTLNRKRYEVRRLDEAPEQLSAAGFWDEKYKAWVGGGEAPGWDLSAPASALKDILPQVKIPRSRVCVLGAGAAHDAAYFASLGHFVTAVDFSATAVEKAKEVYPESAHLKYVVADAFDFAKKNAKQFDVVFEHTFFCAVEPARRDEVVRAWRQLIAADGFLLGVFFVMDRGQGPPFGASEYELRERLKSGFDFLYWTRWKHSIERRQGREIVIYARKKS